MNTDLNAIWRNLNKEAFGDELLPLSAIEYEETSGKDGIGAHGVYFHRSNGIIIDQKFQFDRAKAMVGDEVEAAKAEIVTRLLLHEMVHQALHQRNALRPGKHDTAFIEEATRLSAIVGFEAPTSEQEAERWPEIGQIAAILVQAGVLNF